MRRREKVWRRRLSRKEQAPIDRRCQYGAVAGVARQCVRIGPSCEGIMRPARLVERLQLSPDVVAEKAHDLVDALRGKSAFAGIFQFARKAAAEKAFDAGLAERADMIGAH